jgi:DNA-directed RNA polymerase subunit RPC12/RpoP
MIIADNSIYRCSNCRSTWFRKEWCYQLSRNHKGLVNAEEAPTTDERFRWICANCGTELELHG